MSLFFYSANLICQTKISIYYENVNGAIEFFNKKAYDKALDLLIDCSSDFMFEDDKKFFQQCYDSLLLTRTNYDSKKYKEYAFKLHSNRKEQLPTGFLSGNKVVDIGTDFNVVQNKGKIEILENEVFLISIINTDRFISLVRTNGISEELEDSLYILCANNVLEIFKQKDLPSRLESFSWNDNLALAISHALRSLDFKQQNELLDCLWNHVQLGNLHAFQFAQFYDDVYYIEYGYSSLGVKSEIESYNVEKGQFTQRALPIKSIQNVNDRRKKYFLGDLNEWYKFKDIRYDFNINR